MANEKRTGNYVPSIVGVSTVDGQTTLPIGSIPITNVNPLAMALVDGAGTQITSFGGGTQYTEGDIDASITGTALMWEDTSDTLRAVSAAKPLPVNIVSGSSSGTEYADGAARGTATGSLSMVDDGTNIQSMRGDSSGRPQVNIEQINGVAPSMGNGASGTGVQRVTIANDSTGMLATLTTLTGSGIAHDGADSGNPHKVGAYATNANRTRVANADRTDLIADLAGRLVVQLGHVREMRGKQTTTISASTSETTIVTAAASTYKDLVALIISNTSTSTNTRIDFRDTTAGTVLFSLQAPANQTVGFSLAGHSIPQTTVNTNWTAQCGTSTTDIRILAIFENNT